MAELSVKTNGKFFYTVTGMDLTDEQKAEFDYIPAEEIDFCDFIMHRDMVFDLSEFMRCEGRLKEMGWQGYYEMSAFSAYVIAFDPDDNNSVCIGLATW